MLIVAQYAAYESSESGLNPARPCVPSKLLRSFCISSVVSIQSARKSAIELFQLEINNNLPFLDEFKDNKLCIVIGSSWPEDESILVDFINTYEGLPVKFVIAPHNIKSKQIENIQSGLNKSSVLFTTKEGQNLQDYDVFILDTIGLLSKAYSYANIAYVGGAMGTTGLHNILEPAVFGVPIIIGKNYLKFPEAYDMIAIQEVITVLDVLEQQKKARCRILSNQISALGLNILIENENH